MGWHGASARCVYFYCSAVLSVAYCNVIVIEGGGQTGAWGARQHIGEIVDICVEYLYIASRKKQVDMSVYCSARDMWVCDHVPCHIYVQSI